MYLFSGQGNYISSSETKFMHQIPSQCCAKFIEKLVKKFPAFHGTQKFITVFTWDRSSRPRVTFLNRLVLCGEELLCCRPTSNVEDHLLTTVCDCLFSTLAATLHIWRPYTSSQPEDELCRGARDSRNSLSECNK
jgi:hypothetical protein